MGTTTRCGNLRAIFEAGESDLLNGIARLAIATLKEFGGCLNVMRSTDEFKLASARLSSMDAELIEAADKFVQQNWTRIKDLRNDLAGHVKNLAVEFASGISRMR